MSKEKFLNIANILTLSRIFMGFIFFGLFFLIYFVFDDPFISFIVQIASFILFVLAIITDGLDGYYARKQNVVTDFGKHFDPLADSIFFILVFFTFVVTSYMQWYFFVIIVFREGFMHFFLRPYVKSKGKSLPANIFGKIKTFMQCILTMLLLFELILKNFFLITERNTEVIESVINYSAFIFFLIIALLSLSSLMTYLFGLKKVLES